MGKMIEAFAPGLTSEAVQSFIRQDVNLQKFNSFFKGDGPGRLFVFFQPDMVDGEVRLATKPAVATKFITKSHLQIVHIVLAY